MHEEQIIQRFAQGDADAAEELVRFYYPQILRYCQWRAPNRSMAEDAAQETFLKVVRCFDRYNDRGSFKAYLYRIASNTCIDMGRKLSVHEVSLEDAKPLSDEDLGIKDVETRLTWEQIIRGLPPPQLEVIILRYSQDLTLREISRALDIPLRTAQSRLRAAIKALKQVCEKGDFL